MKKLYFTESQMRNHLLCESVDELKLPKFLFDKIKNHKSFLGDNAAFPPTEDYPFDYKVLKTRYREVYENITKLNLDSLEYDYLVSLLSKLIKECKELETPLRPHLCKICENTVISLLKIPAETVNLTCELVDKVEPKNHAYRTLPETSEHRDFDFQDMEDFHNVSKVVLKRRLINSLIQGISYTYSLNYDLYLSQIYKLDKRLLELYDKIIIINDYLLFLKEVKINDKNPLQSAYVEVELGVKTERTSIFSQAIIFPFLLMETIRGFCELFASHGLPNDNKKALYITKQADFLVAEPWDLRMGVGLWSFIGKDIEDTTILPYLFTSLCEMKVDEFNTFLQEVFAQTTKGKKLIQQLIDDSLSEKEHFEFLDTMKQKNADKAVIEDGDFTFDDLEDNSLTEDNDVAYHGGKADFASFDIAYINSGAGAQNFGYGIYLTFDKDMAKGYADKGGRIYTVEIPSDDDATYLYMREQVDPQILQCIKDKLFELNIDNYIEDYGDEAEQTLTDDLNEWFPIDISGKHLYYSLDKFTNSEKETSELLLSCDVIGYKYTDYDSDCVIMFSSEYIDIIQKEINESYGMVLEYMSSWREDNINALVDTVWDELQPNVNKKKFSKNYQYELNGIKSKIQILYKPINGSNKSKWNGEFLWLTNEIIIHLEGCVSKQDVATAIHHEVTHYIDITRQRNAQKNLYSTYGVDSVKMKGNTANVRLVNTIIYKLWDKLEINAYQSFAMYGYQYIIDYCKDLEDNINQLERSVSPRDQELWEKVKKIFRPNAQMDWKTFKQWFLKRSRLALDKFKKKALKNAYIYQEELNDMEHSNQTYVPLSASANDENDKITQASSGLSFKQQMQIINARFLTIGIQIEKVRNLHPVVVNEDNSYREYLGEININKEQMPLYITEDLTKNEFILSIPNTEINYKFDYEEYDRENITNRQYVGLGKIISAMYKQYEEYKKELEKQEAENAEQEGGE